MKYAVIQCSNGAFSVASEWTDKDKAIVNFHIVCTNLWNSEDVEHASVIIVNEKFITEKIEYIKYDA